jgi:hypothetical protein
MDNVALLAVTEVCKEHKYGLEFVCHSLAWAPAA